MKPTKEQQQAIDVEGTNIIVSAGAGSGKTAVLTARVIRKLFDQVHINELLILTFTNAAAKEMKDRIREAIKKEESLKEELDYIDSSYITTFDSFALSIVKKYHTKLNVSSKIEISDQAIIDLKTKEILETIMDEYYLTPKENFLSLIHDFCLKDDKGLKKDILNCYKKIELKYDKENFLKNYFNIYSEDKVKHWISLYLEGIKEKQLLITDLLKEMESYFDGTFIEKIKSDLKKFLEANTYEEFYQSMDYQGVRVTKNDPEEGKKLKGKIYEILKDLKEDELLYSTEEEMKEELLSTKKHIQVIVDIMKELDHRLEIWKKENEIYNFNDIARFAIRVIEENSDVKEELKNSFQEIMIDEYQDTSDTQEKLISLISENNVYMVGDIKQSIYRFRNANPYIFKSKYDLYRDTNKGQKIDLLKNFRSRKEVLDDVNLLFDYVMDDKIGGAEYQDSHRMIFGNESYNQKGKTNENYHMDILTYNDKELGDITSSEEEAFIIGRDIKKKIESHYPIFDKDQQILRDCTYQDFTILLDRSRDFDLYKKVFQYLHIPMTIMKEESLRKEDDLLVLKNLLKLILLIKDGKEEKDFEYVFVSLSRSFLYRISDEEIYDCIIKKSYQKTKLYQDALELSKRVDELNPSKFYLEVLEKVEYDQKLLKNQDISSYRIREEYFYQLLKRFEKDGSTIDNFINYLDQIIDENYDIKFKTIANTMNSCKIMTIHTSKGLEYPICYYAGFSYKFNLDELKEKIMFSNTYGIILPKVDHSYKETILKKLIKKEIRLEEVGEKMRLFYVALTRAKEKMILVMPELEEEKEVREVLPNYERAAYYSFLSIMKSIYSLLLPYIQKVDGEATKDYLFSIKRQELEKVDKKIIVEELESSSNSITEEHFSKETNIIPSQEEIDKMKFGTLIHEYLEEIDFSKEEELDKITDLNIRKEIECFLQSDLMRNRKNQLMIKEYEFMDKGEHTIEHGVIDLLIEEKEEYIIIDYKLKNIDDEHYDQQLNGYKKYIEKITNKKCRCFLYSILGHKYREVKYEN
ncbi:MAG: UvrD-helicase domain-containing protein [Bacilli bacterium]|nr:UvrD-helicase domain-containing protein [Bacilli bacterium]